MSSKPSPHLGVAMHGFSWVTATIGSVPTFPGTHRWKRRVEVLDLLCPRLLDLNLKLAIETHADFTAFELLDLLGRLDARAFGVTLDTGNLVMRLDDPVGRDN